MWAGGGVFGGELWEDARESRSGRRQLVAGGGGVGGAGASGFGDMHLFVGLCRPGASTLKTVV